MASDVLEKQIEEMKLSALDVEMLSAMVADDEAPKPKRGRPARQDRSGETPQERTARKTVEQRERRRAEKAKAAELGTVMWNADTERQALADCAMMLLREGGDVADRIEAMLGKVYNVQVGAPMSIRAACVNRTTKPKYLKYPEPTAEERLRKVRYMFSI